MENSTAAELRRPNLAVGSAAIAALAVTDPSPFFSPVNDGPASTDEWSPSGYGALVSEDFDAPIAYVPHDRMSLRDRLLRTPTYVPELTTPAGENEVRPLCIRAADSLGQRSSASVLVSKMYAWRGYQCSGQSAAESQSTNRITLVASDHHTTIGTITIGFDNPGGLLVDDLFPHEVNELREQGRVVCEFTKLAIDGVIRSKRLIASLFHVAYLFAHRINQSDCLLIEVNPRHVRYYQKVLGFTILSAERTNQRVNAPAVLMCLELRYAREQIAQFAGLGEKAACERSLYPFFFSSKEEGGILGRMQRQ